MEFDFKKAVELMKNGQEEGFNKLFEATYNKVYFRARQCTRTESDAQDLTQITFVEAYKNIAKLEAPEATLSWLYTIVYNQSCKMYRSEREKREFLLAEEAEGVLDIIESSDIETMPELSADQKATAEILKGIIEELPELQKMTVLAFYFDGLKLEQIAQTMDCSVNTVKSRLNYAKKYMKDRIEAEEKKGGYKLRAVTLPTLLLALHLLSKKYTLSVHAAEKIYQESCGTLGLKPSLLSLSEAISTSKTQAMTGAETGTMTEVAQGAKTGTMTKAVSGAAGTGVQVGTVKALIIAGVVVVGASAVGGGIYLYQKANVKESVSSEAVGDESVEDLKSDLVEQISEETPSPTPTPREEYDFTELISLSNFNGEEAMHPQRISEFEYYFSGDDFRKITTEYAQLDIAVHKLPEGVWCEYYQFGDYIEDSPGPNNAGSVFGPEGAYETGMLLKFTDREYVATANPNVEYADSETLDHANDDTTNATVNNATSTNSAANTSDTANNSTTASKDKPIAGSGNKTTAEAATGIVLSEMIGEWSAKDGTKLWIATSDGSIPGASIEFIKQQNIGWSDAELSKIEGDTAVFNYQNKGTIKVVLKDSKHIRITYNIKNDFGGTWKDTVDYTLTNRGYEYYGN